MNNEKPMPAPHKKEVENIDIGVAGLKVSTDRQTLNQLRSEQLKKEQKKARLLRFLCVAIVVMGLTMAIGAYLVESGFEIRRQIEQYSFTLLGALVASMGFSAYFGYSTGFSDIDDRRAAEKYSNLNPQAAWPFPVGESKGGGEQLSFDRALRRVGAELAESADDANRKASKMLDTGQKFAVGGFLFFTGTVFIWQSVFSLVGFHTWHIYGIVSCASLFVAAEVISAWFLKQYRHFIEASTHYIQIKAVFDRYLLLKLAESEITGGGAKNSVLCEVLAKDMVWPSAFKDQNVSGPMDMKAIESLILALGKLRGNDEQKSKRE